MWPARESVPQSGPYGPTAPQFHCLWGRATAHPVFPELWGLLSSTYCKWERGLRLSEEQNTRLLTYCITIGRQHFGSKIQSCSQKVHQPSHHQLIELEIHGCLQRAAWGKERFHLILRKEFWTLKVICANMRKEIRYKTRRGNDGHLSIKVWPKFLGRRFRRAVFSELRTNTFLKWQCKMFLL